MQRFVICKEYDDIHFGVYHYADVRKAREEENGWPRPKAGRKPIITFLKTVTEARHHHSVIESRHGFNSKNYRDFARRS